MIYSSNLKHPISKSKNINLKKFSINLINRYQHQDNPILITQTVDADFSYPY
jgi:hypothetical protein